MIKIDVLKQFKNFRLRFQFEASTNRIVVFGPSGSGKSVLLKMIAGFFDPDAGSIFIEDRCLFDNRKSVIQAIYERNIGYLPQEYTLFPNMTVRENILYGVNIRKLKIDKSKFDLLVERLGISGLLDQQPESLSGGQKQRAALARVLLVNPQILLLDEPFSALDSTIRETLRDLVIDLADELNIITVFVTHDLEDAFIFGKDFVLVNKGEVIEFGPRNTLFDRPKYAETASLIGFINIWPVLRLQGSEVQTPQGHLFTFKGDYPPEHDKMCIRPENIMFMREDKPFKEFLKRNLVFGSITSIHDRGRYRNLTFVTSEGLSMEVNLPEHAFRRLKLEKDKLFTVSLKEESIILCQNRK